MDDISSGVHLEQFVLLAKQAKGAGLVSLIQGALEHPRCFVFGELLEMPNVMALESSEHSDWVTLLKIFAYETWNVYSASSLPELSPAAVRKLKQLTVVSLAAAQKNVPYALLTDATGVDNVRQLEDLVIECIYLGLVGGKLDQRAGVFVASHVMGRDVRPEHVGALLDDINRWVSRTEHVLELAKRQIDSVETMQQMVEQKNAQHEKDMEIAMNAAKEKAQQGDRGGRRATRQVQDALDLQMGALGGFLGMGSRH